MTADPNPEIIEQKTGIAYGAFGGLLGAAMMYIGDQLNLYKTMHGAGVLSAGDIAARQGLSERFVREWLYHQASTGMVELRGKDRFELLPEAGLVVADSSFPLSFAGSIQYLPAAFTQAIDSHEAFTSGLGKTYDQMGADFARQIDAFFSGWNRAFLVSDALPRLDGVVARLESGGTVADVGCGAGAAPIAVAQAFPNAKVHGYDNSAHALAVAKDRVSDAGLTNITLHNPDDDPLPATPAYDLIMTLDCLHDMTRPDIVAAAIRKALKPDGVWFIVDIDGAPTVEENLANPLAPMLFAASVTTCLQSAVSSKDNLGLGTFGLPEPAMGALVTNAGFTRFQRVTGMEHPLNAYYEVRI